MDKDILVSSRIPQTYSAKSLYGYNQGTWYGEGWIVTALYDQSRDASIP